MFSPEQLQDMFEAVDSMAEFGRQNLRAIQPEVEPDAYLETCKEVAGYEQLGNQIEAVIEMGKTVKGKWIYVSDTDEATIRALSDVIITDNISMTETIVKDGKGGSIMVDPTELYQNAVENCVSKMEDRSDIQAMIDFLTEQLNSPYVP